MPLPRLPVPPLRASVDRFLRALHPLLPADALAAEERAAEAFLRADGPGLQAVLEERARRSAPGSSYVGPFWDDMYLEGRWPLAVHSNPGTAEGGGRWGGGHGREARAAAAVAATLAFFADVREGTLPRERIRGKEVDDAQTKRMEGMTRTPRRGRDVLTQHADATHVCVLWKGHFFRVDVLDPRSRVAKPVEEIFRLLQGVVHAVPSGPSPPLAALTTLDRDTWADLYDELKATSTPGVLERDVCGALFHVCLDEDPFPTRNAMVRSALHGNGSNRWFDHGLSVHFGPDGTFTHSFEHSWGDGMAVLQWARYVHERGPGLLEALPRRSVPQLGVHQPPPLSWGSSLSPRVTSAAREAHDKFVRFTNQDLLLETRVFSGFGVQQLKAWKVSSDGVFQNAIQLAYRRLKGKTVATYESCSTQTFQGGRTETIRSATVESWDWVREMLDCLVEDTQSRARLLRRAAERHAELALDAAEGRGFDRHLFVLRKLAEKEGVQPPMLFGTGFDVLSKNILSTSTVSHPWTEQAAFGPVVRNGLGICYHFFPDRIHFCVTAYEGNDAVDMADQLERALRECGGLLEKSQ